MTSAEFGLWGITQNFPMKGLKAVFPGFPAVERRADDILVVVFSLPAQFGKRPAKFFPRRKGGKLPRTHSA